MRSYFATSAQDKGSRIMPEDLVNRLKHGPSENYYGALAELEEIKFEWQEKLNEAQIKAAEAAIEAADAAKRTAKYMWWSVLAIFATSGVSAVCAVVQVMH
jgi:hypothetical protein